MNGQHCQRTNLDSESYAYNLAAQRTVETNTAGDYRNYTYDNIGELKTALGKESGGTTNRLHEQFGYAYDAAGNLNQRTNNALIQNFGVNNLNELTALTRSGTLTVAGTTTSQATNVTVNSSMANLYADNAFALGGFSLVDGYNTFTAIAKDSYGRKDTNSITVNLPATNAFAYDFNGNLLTNGTEVLVWNDENELVTNFVSGSWKSEFVYDGRLRRRIERDYSWNGSSWTQTNEIHFIYDGNVIIQHRDINSLPTLTLTRGNDLSGSLQGAGGIGGLLAMTESYAINPIHSYYHSDGNGNVTMLISSNQLQVGKAEYDPFGSFLLLNGSKAGINSYWYSSKPIHWQSGKYDYLLRWYSPILQRWPNRDPLMDFGSTAFDQIPQRSSFDVYRKEQREPNGYEFINNDPIIRFDAFGLQSWMGPGYGALSGPLSGGGNGSGSNFPGVIDSSIVAGFGGGVSTIYCCNENHRRIKATFKKWCVGPYIGASATVGFQQGVSGSGCPMKYTGWFIEAGGGYGIAAGGGAVSPDGSVGAPGIGIGLGGGIMWCKYILISAEDVGCCQ